MVGKVFGGRDSLAGKWPWQASLLYRDLHLCGAVLIDSYWLVTTAHCFQKYPTTAALAPPISWNLQHNPGFTFTASYNSLFGLPCRDSPATCLMSSAFLNNRERIHNPLTSVSSTPLKPEPYS
ncbi:putative serine protease 47 isoform X1 [Cricetulus griseus]|uniref:putative serine protease 47 isoform X1 n=1 Tax=Cricetulus griseus TaxID=10029 RepID=UPI0007DA90DE|nr:putative serine protease 47 isoform X1 [Cricetulus griseus]